jgi:hypothetical protein
LIGWRRRRLLGALKGGEQGTRGEGVASVVEEEQRIMQRQARKKREREEEQARAKAVEAASCQLQIGAAVAGDAMELSTSPVGELLRRNADEPVGAVETKPAVPAVADVVPVLDARCYCHKRKCTACRGCLDKHCACAKDGDQCTLQLATPASAPKTTLSNKTTTKHSTTTATTSSSKKGAKTKGAKTKGPRPYFVVYNRTEHASMDWDAEDLLRWVTSKVKL